MDVSEGFPHSGTQCMVHSSCPWTRWRASHLNGCHVRLHFPHSGNVWLVVASPCRIGSFPGAEPTANSWLLQWLLYNRDCTDETTNLCLMRTDIYLLHFYEAILRIFLEEIYIYRAILRIIATALEGALYGGPQSLCSSIVLVCAALATPANSLVCKMP